MKLRKLIHLLVVLKVLHILYVLPVALPNKIDIIFLSIFVLMDQVTELLGWRWHES